MFSGDMTAAPKPNGAAEALYVTKSEDDYLIFLNFYNYWLHREPETVPFTFLISFSDYNIDGSEQVRDYIINPNNILLQSQMEIGKREICFGIIHTGEESTCFYFKTNYC